MSFLSGGYACQLQATTEVVAVNAKAVADIDEGERPRSICGPDPESGLAVYTVLRVARRQPPEAAEVLDSLCQYGLA